MKVLIIGTLYQPDLGPSAPLFTLLSENLARLGHQVTVITMVPHFPSGQVSISYRGKILASSIENEVKVIRVGLPSVNRQRLFQRFIQYFCYQVGAVIASLGQNYDIVLAANPFLTVWLPFAFSVVLRRKPVLYSVQDVYPDVGINLGIFRHKLVIKTVSILERFCLNHADTVQIISDSFRPGLRSLGVPDSKMVLVYDWVDTELIHPLPKDNSFSQELGLNDAFVIQYAGNIGFSQGVEHLLTTAKLLEGQKDIRFILVGNGVALESLYTQAEHNQLTNVQFVPFQPRERLPQVLASADVSLVILRKGIGLDSLPSKTYSIMASGRPILLSVDEGSETYKLVKRAGAGICVPPENPAELAKAILNLKEDKDLRERLGQYGRTWAEKYHSPQAAAKQFEKLLLNAISNYSDNRSDP